ncbi:MAG: chemotaxis protein CheW [Deltaproteobacteria bacterium]|nr:chemotaxis protein CheW [Deltaproteobacteria bacterium]
MNERVDLQEFIGGFVVEADELVALATASLVEIETGNATGANRPKAVRELFRALHTIKGLAAMIGVEPIVEISHALETLIRTADKGGGRLRQGAIDVSIQGVRAIGERVRAVAEQRTPAAAPPGLIETIATTDVASDAPSAPPPLAHAWDSRLSLGERQHLYQGLRSGMIAYALTFQPSEDKVAKGITIATVRARLAELGEVVKVAPRTVTHPVRGVVFDVLFIGNAEPAKIAEATTVAVDSLERIALPVGPADTELPIELVEEASAVTPLGRSIVRVELARLDELQEQLSLLIVSRFRLEREIVALAASGVDVRRLREVSDLQTRQLRDLRRAILRARLIRVGEVLEPLTLLVRSLVKPGYKEVRLSLDTRDSELDKAVADRLLPAIVHLVRNAIDHAIEPIDERRSKDKPAVGSLRVTCAETSGNRLELSITDDGRGIDRDAIARRANRQIPDDDALIDVLTTPGFSTRDVATETSGRGLGMDIVRRIIVDQLGGELRVRTELGAGTTFRMLVPVTIAIIDVFSFSCGSQSFVVPVAAVEEIFELAPEQRVSPPSSGGAAGVSLLERRGKAITLVSLGEVLAIDPGTSASKALVVRRNGEPIAFAVDRMLGRQEVVVRPIDDILARAPGIAGATDLGDGRPTLVLDLVELGAKIASRERSA